MSGIFISYRRSVSRDLAQLIFHVLRTRGYDVFLDVNTIDSGQFDRIILNQIAARPHFLLILKPGSLQRCADPGDWLRCEIEEALRLKRNIVPIYDEGFNIEDEKQYLPEPLRTELSRLNARRYFHDYSDAFMDSLADRFLKMPEYDNIPVTPTPPAERVEVQQRIDKASESDYAPIEFDLKNVPLAARRYPKGKLQVVQADRSVLLPLPPDLSSILPPPFEWIHISAGKVMLEAGGYVPEGGQTFEVPAFYIAKYPVTNAQFAKFIDAGGYTNRQWWTDAGWRLKKSQNWAEPRYWRDKKWNGADYPVVGISWYESLAFSNWLSAAVGAIHESPLRITLPTEQQWQRAAQGDDGRKYPWGNQWDSNRCNTSESDIGCTTPVGQYESIGDSPYGVVDMAGNVWEWCLTKWSDGSDDPLGEEWRVLRGGSFFYARSFAACAYRYPNDPNRDHYSFGVRLVLAAPIS